MPAVGTVMNFLPQAVFGKAWAIKLSELPVLEHEIFILPEPENTATLLQNTPPALNDRILEPVKSVPV